MRAYRKKTNLQFLLDQTEESETPSQSSSSSQTSSQSNTPVKRLSNFIMEAAATGTNNRDLAKHADQVEAIDKMISEIHVVPTKCLVQPEEGYRVRDVDQSFVEVLYKKMLREPTATYLPLIIMVTSNKPDQVILNNLEDYKFQVLGGNHSRIVCQNILAAHPDAVKFQTRICRIYKNLTPQEAQKVSFIVSFCNIIRLLSNTTQ